MPRILKDLKISEVSGVDRGAGEGVRVVLMKRHNQPGEIEMKPEELQALIAEGVTKVLPGLIEKSVAEIKKAGEDALAKANGEIAVLKMSGDEKAFCEKKGMDADAMKAFAAKTPEERKAAMSKAADEGKLPVEVAKALETSTSDLRKANETIADMQKRLAAHDEREAVATFAKRATDAGLKPEDGEIMRKAYSGDTDAQTKLDAKFTELTKSLKAARETGQIFNEFGANGGDGAGTGAYAQLVAKATELRKTAEGAKLTQEQAFTKVYTDPANAELAKLSRREEMVRKTAAISSAA